MTVRLGTLALAALGACAALVAPRVAAAASPRGTLVARVAASYDSARGGFVDRGGAPEEDAVELAFALGEGPGGRLWERRALQTVAWTRSLFDSVGGGFYRRERDADPSRPSFSKTTISNARRLENWLDALAATRDERYRRDAVRIADYFERVLLDPRGGFVAGQGGSRDMLPEANGYAIHAWLRWAAESGRTVTRDFAWKSLDRVWEDCWHPDLGLLRRDNFGRVIDAPQLVDQVEMGRAFVLAAHYGGRGADLERARLLGDLLIHNFEDEHGGFRTQAVPKKNGGIKRAARLSDENARAARFLMELAAVSGDKRYRLAAMRAVAAFQDRFDKAGEEAADWVLALRTTSVESLPASLRWPSEHERQHRPRRHGATRRGSRG